MVCVYSRKFRYTVWFCIFLFLYLYACAVEIPKFLRILNCLQNINEWRNENWNVFLTHTKNKSSKFGKHCIMFYLIGSNFGGLVEFLFQLRQCIFISDEFNWLLEVIPLRFRNEIGFLSGLSQWHFISGFQWYNFKISVKFIQNENTLL